MWWLCAVFLLLISITSCRREAPVRMFSEKEYHYEERLSALSSDSSAYWVGTETGVIWHVSGEKRQRLTRDWTVSTMWNGTCGIRKDCG